MTDNVNKLLIDALNKIDTLNAEVAYLRGEVEAHRQMRKRDIAELRQRRAAMYPEGVK